MTINEIVKEMIEGLDKLLYQANAIRRNKAFPENT